MLPRDANDAFVRRLIRVVIGAEEVRDDLLRTIEQRGLRREQCKGEARLRGCGGQADVRPGRVNQPDCQRRLAKLSRLIAWKADVLVQEDISTPLCQ